MQDTIIELEARRCQNGSVAHPGWCPTVWDGIVCWHSTPAGVDAVKACPDYIAGFDLPDNATKHCGANGDWYWSVEHNSVWTNYTRCYNNQLVTVLMDLPDLQSSNVTSIEKYLPTIKSISKIGYTVSLVTLIIALCILASIKKLRCQRNILHMHLFVSFIARALTFLLKNFLLVDGVGLSTDVLIKDGESYLLGDKFESNVLCKALTSIWQYCILANYSWILMEGLYLHNLIFCALFTDADESVTMYAILGWVMPVVFVIPWIILRAVYEDIYCWTTHKNTLIFQLIKVPTMLSVIINFILFVNIVRVLLMKLKSTISEDTKRYLRWLKSTLVLVPLFGAHYFIFLIMSYSTGVNETVEIVWLFCDQLFASFQGSFVAVLYCFLNGEVRSELSRTLHSRNLPSLWELCRGKPSTRSGSTCSCNTTTGGTGAVNSHGWCWPCCRRFVKIYRHTAAGHNRSIHSMASTQDIGIGPRGGSLNSSRGYLEVTTGAVNNPADRTPTGNNQTASMQTNNHDQDSSTPSRCKSVDQSLRAFCSTPAEGENGETTSALSHEKYHLYDNPEQNCKHEWSDSECCKLTLELHHLNRKDDT